MIGLSGWRAALRIARRDALRAKGRSILVIAMLALPILGVGAADITLRTSQLSTAEHLERETGTAEARFEDLNQSGAIMQEPVGDRLGYVGEPVPDDTARATVGDLLPGATLLPDTLLYGVGVRTDAGVMDAEVRELEAADPMARGILTLLDGAYPAAPGQVAVSEEFAEHSGLGIGAQVVFSAAESSAFQVVGVFEDPGDLKARTVLAQPEAVSGVLEGAAVEYRETSWLADVAGGVSWEQVVTANTHGYRVTSRTVHADPPPDSAVPLYRMEDGTPFDGGVPREAVMVLVTAVALVIMEICLLAGPAFAVGARRARRMLGLVGANGGDRRHIRAIMLSSGLVLGAAAAVVGVVLALVGFALARPWLEDVSGSRFGALDLRPLELLGVVGLGVLTGLMAALLPAVHAARTPVLESLTGRRGVRRAGRALPVVGLAAFLLGAALAVLGGMTMDSPVVVAVGAILAQLGLVALTPVLVGAFGRLGRFLPLSGRLALRDAVRNRSRTAPAVAAVLAAVSGTVAVATMLASDTERQRAAYEALAPYGTVVLQEPETGRTAGLDAARQAAERHLPVERRADARVISTGEDCGLWGGSKDCGVVEMPVPPENECDWDAHMAIIDAVRAGGSRAGEAEPDWRCTEQWRGSVLDAQYVVAGPELLRVLGLDAPEAVAALERGEAVAFQRSQIADDGTVTLEYFEQDPYLAEGYDWEAAEESGERPEPDRRLTVPAVLYPADEDDDYGVSLVVPPSAMAGSGLELAGYATVYSTGGPLGEQARQAFQGALDDLDGAPASYIEAGFEKETGLALLALALFAGIVTLGAAGIATGLAQADSESDLATLAAVGAPPRVRRTLSGLQCAVIAGMGVVLGAVSGVVPGLGMLLAQHRERLSRWEEWGEVFGDGQAPELFIELPWMTWLQLIVVVPLLAGLLAALLTRSRIGLARRAG